MNGECCSAVIHTRPGDTQRCAFGLTRVHNVECTPASGALLALRKMQEENNIIWRAEKKKQPFFLKFPLLSVNLSKTTEMEPLGYNNWNLLPPSSMWFPL